MATAYTGHQQSYRDMTREQLTAFGLQHAPAVVNPPPNRCEECGTSTVLRYYKARVGWVCEHCNTWPGVGDRYDPECGMQLCDEWLRDFQAILMEERNDDIDAEAIAECYAARSGGCLGESPCPQYAPEIAEIIYRPFTEREKAYRRLFKQTAQWDEMWRAQQRWQSARATSEARRGDVWPDRDKVTA